MEAHKKNDIKTKTFEQCHNKIRWESLLLKIPKHQCFGTNHVYLQDSHSLPTLEERRKGKQEVTKGEGTEDCRAADRSSLKACWPIWEQQLNWTASVFSNTRPVGRATAMTGGLPGVSNLLESLGHIWRRVVLGHTLNTLTLIETDKQKKVLSKFTVLCWATFIAILGHTGWTPRTAPGLMFRIGTQNSKKLLSTEANLSRTRKIEKKERETPDQIERQKQARKS